MVIAYHLIWTAYGWWLPNDLRGSYSHIVKGPQIAELAELHYGRRAIQPASHEIRQFYEQASRILRYPLLKINSTATSRIAKAFEETIAARHYTCYACAIMPDHVHILIRKHRDRAEDMILQLQQSSRDALIASTLRNPEHPTWSLGGWKAFLDHPDEVRRTIRYIEQNPVKIRRAIQRYSFVTEYDNWPLHDGHSENSPYVRALRASKR